MRDITNEDIKALEGLSQQKLRALEKAFRRFSDSLDICQEAHRALSKVLKVYDHAFKAEKEEQEE